jgi:hypothetical protein
MRDTNYFVTMSNEDIKLEFLGNLVWVKFDNNPRDSILFTNLYSNQMGFHGINQPTLNNGVFDSPSSTSWVCRC